MELQLIRNATLRLNYAGKTILVDPMFSPKGAFDPFAGKARNPTTELPMPPGQITEGLDLILVTHIHPDHFDPAAITMLDKSVKLFCQPANLDAIKANGFAGTETIEASVSWQGIRISRTGGQHGRGNILDRMGAVSGFVLEAAGEPTLYIVGDCVFTEQIKDQVRQYAPRVIVTNSGGAIIPGFEATPILMDEEETVALAEWAPDAQVVAVHLESLDHCSVTRKSLREKADAHAIASERFFIPGDGELLRLV